jgi:hypothetical protein
MFALIDNQQITKFFSGNKGVTLGDIQYPKSIFTLWSEAERNAIGIYVVTVDTTNKKDEQWYINTDVSYGVESNKAVGSYGTATPKLLEDRNEVDDAGEPLLDDNGNQIVTKGLKSQKKDIIKKQAAGILQNTDWYITRKADAGTAVPSAVTTHRAAVRTKSNEMETAIDNAADVDALAALYVYTDGERPLGEFPVLEI